jgi:phosphohistidine phosphatase SixA
MTMAACMRFAIVAAALLLAGAGAAQRGEAQERAAQHAAGGRAAPGHAALGHAALGHAAGLGADPWEDGARQQAGATLVIIVRHAEKLDDSEDPLLNEAGVQRAEALARALEHAEVSVIYTTPLRRTRDTAAPLAARTGVPVMVVETQGTALERATDLAARIRGQPRGSVVLVVGHSNTVPAIIAALGGPDIGVISDDEYADFFVLHLAGDRARLVRSRY